MASWHADTCLCLFCKKILQIVRINPQSKPFSSQTPTPQTLALRLWTLDPFLSSPRRRRRCLHLRIDEGWGGNWRGGAHGRVEGWRRVLAPEDPSTFFGSECPSNKSDISSHRSGQPPEACDVRAASSSRWALAWIQLAPIWHSFSPVSFLQIPLDLPLL